MRFSRRALLVLGLFSAAAHAQCPVGHDAMGERLFSHGGTSYKAQLCWNPRGDASVAGGSLRVTVYQGEHRAAEASFPVDVEGEVKGIHFDRASYVLSARAPTFPVLVDARLRGVAFDQYSTDLWLLTLDSGKLKQVLVQNVVWDSWATQCQTDCVETSKSKTVLIIAPQKSAQGMSDLKLRTRGSSTPYGQDAKQAQLTDKTTHYVFNGEVYTAQD
jgi:hypothetical protein